jgi:hypothetical protein
MSLHTPTLKLFNQNSIYIHYILCNDWKVLEMQYTNKTRKCDDRNIRKHGESFSFVCIVL